MPGFTVFGRSTSQDGTIYDKKMYSKPPSYSNTSCHAIGAVDWTCTPVLPPKYYGVVSAAPRAAVHCSLFTVHDENLATKVNYICF